MLARTRAPPRLVGDVELGARPAPRHRRRAAARTRGRAGRRRRSRARGSCVARRERRARGRPEVAHALVVPAHVLLVGIGRVVLLGDVVAEHDVGERLEAVRDLPGDVDAEAVVAVDVDRPGDAVRWASPRAGRARTTRARPCGQKKRSSWPRRCQCRPRITPCCENEMFVCSDGLPPESSRYHDSRRSSQNQPRSSPNLRRVTTRTPSTGVLSIGGVTRVTIRQVASCGSVGACEGAVGQREQVLAVAVLAQRLRQREQPVARRSSRSGRRSPRGRRP